MKKRILAVVLSVIMLLGLIPLTAFADTEAKVTFTTTADKTVAAPGETVTFSTYVQATEISCGWNFELVIPDGLTYVEGSAKLPEGIVTTIGAVGGGEVCMFTESSKVYAVAAGLAGTGATNIYDEPLMLLTYQCTVNADATEGDYTVTIGGDDMDVMDAEASSLDVADYEIVGATVTVEVPPKVTFTTTADKTNVVPGDTVEFSVYAQATVVSCGWNFELVIPEGLTYVEGSAALPEDIITTIGAVGGGEVCMFTESSKVYAVAAGLAGTGATNIYDAPLLLLTYQCTVDADAAEGDYTVTIGGDDMDVMDAEASSIDASDYKIVDATVSVIVPTTGIMLDKAEARLSKAEPTVQLTATVEPDTASDKTVTWESSNKDVATVDKNGLVTRVGEGVAVITATASGGQKAECSVTVIHECEAATLTEVDAAEPTCTQDGNSAHYKCSCGKLYGDKNATQEVTEEDVTIQKTGHTDGEWKVTTEATCTGVGEETLYCAVCEVAIDTREIEETGHTDGEWKVTTEATCTEAGEETLYCAVCEVAIDTREIEETGHTDGEWKVTTEPTCTEAGEETLYCAVCEEAIDTREISAAGHDYKSVVTEPTCTEGGYTTYTCSVCTASYVADEVPATDHDYSGEYVEDPAKPGTWYLYCANDCGEILDTDVRTIFVEGVSLDQDYVETYYVRKAPAFTLTEIIAPENADEDYKVTWTSSNEKVATVDEDGNVTTHKRGEAVITVTVEKEDGTTYSASCNVKVKYTFCQWLIWFFLLGCCWYFV